MNHSRKKLLAAILFFAKNVRKLNTTKLSKLLFFLDFEHFKQTGYPSIGLNYHAFDKGPVPKKFWLEIKEGITPRDFRESLMIERTSDVDEEYKELKFIAKISPDMRVFSPREKNILERLAEMYKTATASQLSEITHLKNTPWDKSYRQGAGRNSPIDYHLALDDDATCDYNVASEQLNEFFAVQKKFSTSPTS